MVYHNFYHRIDGILLTSSSYGKRQLGISRGIGANQKRRNILTEKDNGVSSEMCIHVLCIV